MCGILALLNIPCNMTRRSIKHAKKISHLQKHRGPDYSGIAVLKNNILCHERLAIIDTNSGSQPFISKCQDGIAMAINGEIYNYKELITKLKCKHQFESNSDCEVLIHLYEEYGCDFLTEFRINGMFAFVILDTHNNTYVVGRDHIGICPLYMGKYLNGAICFSSELKCLTHCRNIQIFNPGTYIIGALENQQSKTHKVIQYYNPIWHYKIGDYTSNNLNYIIKSSLKQSVESHMMSDVPYGVLLSGGLDSSIIAALATDILQKKDPNIKLHTFSIGLQGSVDLERAEQMAKHLNSIHHSFTFTIEEGLQELKKVIWHIETYDVTTVRASVPMYILARNIQELGFKMVLSGEGADEMFGGYLYFHKAPNKKEFYEETVRKINSLHLYDCLRANKAMAAFGVECRVPFLDIDFLDLIMNLDPEYKLIKSASKNSDRKNIDDNKTQCIDDDKPQRIDDNKTQCIEKYILRSAFSDLLPNEILWRQKEQFSDGVGYKWIDSLKKKAEEKVKDFHMKMAKYSFPINTPHTKEAYMYRTIFEEHFNSFNGAIKTVPYGFSVACSSSAVLRWDRSFKKNNDPSGRCVDVHFDKL